MKNSACAVERGSALFATWPTAHDTNNLKPSASRAGEKLAAELIGSLLWPRSTIVDAGCGTGHLTGAWLADKHRVIGIQDDPDLLDALHGADLHPAFTLREASTETVEIAHGSVDLVASFDALAEAHDPAACVARFADWVRPGGAVCVRVDSLVTRHGELMRDGREAEASCLLTTGVGRTSDTQDGARAHLFTASSLRNLLRAAGLVDVQVRGLLIGASLWGRIGVAARMRHDEEAYLALERGFWREAALADLGVHLFASGRRPRTTAETW